MAHKHFCMVCPALIEEGDFDCEVDSDHDYRLCDQCAAELAEVRHSGVMEKLEGELRASGRLGPVF